MVNPDQVAIAKMLDIYPPFLMIDKVVELVEGERITTTKTLLESDWYFKSHLPSVGAMPGTLLTEAALQSMAFLIASSLKTTQKALVKKIAVDILATAKPGNHLTIFATQSSCRLGLIKGKAQVQVSKKTICEVEFLYVLPTMAKALTPKF